MADNQPTPDTADHTPEGRTPEQVSDPQEPSQSEAPTGAPTKSAAKSAKATSKASPGNNTAKATKSTKPAKTAKASKSAVKANGGSGEASAKSASGPAKSASAEAAKPPANAADPTAKTPKPKAPDAPKATKATKPKATKPAKKAGETARRPATAAESPAPPAETPVAAKPATPSSNGRAGASAPQKPTEPSTPAPVPSPLARWNTRASAPPPALPRRLPQPRVWFDAGWEAVRQLDEPPHDLLELAVAELGPQAEAWAGWLRETYPGAPADGMARLATQQARRHGGLLASTGALGPLAAALQLPALAATRVALVLRMAAVHGHDPADPARVADLVALLDLDPGAGRSRVVRGLGLAFRAAGLLGRRRNPVGMAWALLSVGEQRDDLERLAHRTARHYRGLTTADRPAR